MKIYVFSPTLETLGVVSDFSSLVHTRQFAGSGSFKLKAPHSDKLFSLLVKDNILYWEDGGTPAAVYIDSVICETERKKEVLTASGKNLRALLGRRIIWTNITFSGTVEDFGRRVANENAIAPTDPARVIPLLSLAPRKGLTDTITTQTENENLEELLDTVSAASGTGFDVLLDKEARRLLFTAYGGADHRISQNVNPWIIVSRDRNNVVTQTYTRSDAASRNTALISGYTDEETGVRYERAITAGSGLARREVFVKGPSSKPKPDKDTGETEAQAAARYEAEVLQKGREKLAAQVDVLALECELDPALAARLSPGDKVTAIESKYHLTAQTYISEITAYYERGGQSYDVTLGDAVPTIYEKLKKEIV